MQIRNKIVVITGGASGLGLATTRYLVETHGAKVAIFDLNEEAGAAVAKEYGEDSVLFVATDVADEASVRSAVETTLAKFGAIHVCINCAAYPLAQKILDKEGKAYPIEKFARSASVNLVGLFNVMAKCAEPMAKNQPEAGEERGVIINISSGAAYEGQIGQCGYGSTKAAVIGLNLPAARELGDYGIRVNAIAPGLFLTPMVQGLGEKVVDSLRARIEAPKRLGDMREFAHCCAFIIENAYLNGETIRLDAASRLTAR